ncbi:DUF6587 family protein [Arenimonas fontis]|uniref:Uncharacterized protein n=1 Tax=Arenimonas fontis TaxID=2608255 RepID=A0A5B2Z9A6_9GAMM|nr:DUF6587 family protein [Arenimonas fontis]KAA2284495.1 hypothetical protein F0415_09215 [Arenimonas fontis]
MNAYWPLLENSLLAVVVLAAALYSFKRVMPGTWRRVQVAVVLFLLNRRSPLLRGLGRKIAPMARLAPGPGGRRVTANCGNSGCGGCGKD